jgi:hypothetical protein
MKPDALGAMRYAAKCDSADTIENYSRRSYEFDTLLQNERGRQ